MSLPTITFTCDHVSVALADQRCDQPAEYGMVRFCCRDALLRCEHHQEVLLIEGAWQCSRCSVRFPGSVRPEDRFKRIVWLKGDVA